MEKNERKVREREENSGVTCLFGPTGSDINPNNVVVHLFFILFRLKCHGCLVTSHCLLFPDINSNKTEIFKYLRNFRRSEKNLKLEIKVSRNNKQAEDIQAQV